MNQVEPHAGTKRASSFHDLKAWQEAMRLCQTVQSWVDQPSEVPEPVRERMLSLAVRAPSRLAEGHTLRTPREFMTRIRQAVSALAEIYTLSVLMQARGGNAVDSLEDQALKVMRMCGGLMGYLRKQTLNGKRTANSGK